MPSAVFDMALSGLYNDGNLQKRDSSSSRSRSRSRDRMEDDDGASYRCSLPQEKDKISELVRQKPGKGYTGLLVRHEHAVKFVEGIKIWEIRSWEVKFLRPGDCIVLVSMQKGMRCAMAILEYIQSTQIQDDDFCNHFDKHQVSEETYRGMKSSWRKKFGHSWAWQFKLIHKFERPLHFSRSFPGTEVWLHFTLDCLCSDPAPASGPGTISGLGGPTAEGDTCQDHMWPPTQWADIFLRTVGLEVDSFHTNLET